MDQPSLSFLSLRFGGISIFSFMEAPMAFFWQHADNPDGPTLHDSVFTARPQYYQRPHYPYQLQIIQPQIHPPGLPYTFGSTSSFLKFSLHNRFLKVVATTNIDDKSETDPRIFSRLSGKTKHMSILILRGECMSLFQFRPNTNIYTSYFSAI